MAVVSIRKNFRDRSRKLRCGMEVLLVGFLVFVGLVAVLNVFVTIGFHSKSGGGSSNKVQTQSSSKRTSSTTDGHIRDANSFKYHVVFSTSCSYSHDWQSYLFFFHAMAHNQPGDVTRIVSGCNPEQEKEMRELHEKQFSIMNPNFLIHFTPEFGKPLPGVSFQLTKYWNKPFGLKHWLEHRFGYKYEGDISTPHDDGIVILVDPDMLMQRPFLNDFTDFPDTLWIEYYKKHPEEKLVRQVSHGHPISQDYSFGATWLRAVQHNLTYVVGPDSPVHKIKTDEEAYLYSAGPPYWMTVRDAYRISYHWADFLPRMFEVKAFFMQEMYGFCMASAHLGLKQQLARGFMVSNVEMTHGEGWTFLDNSDDTVCDVSQFQKTTPHVIHFCQRYSVGEYFLNKYLFPSDVLSCDFPLLELPPLDIVSYTNYSHYGDGTIEVWGPKKGLQQRRHAFVICSLMPALNKAATFFKDHHCPNGANYETTYNHFRHGGEKAEKQGHTKK